MELNKNDIIDILKDNFNIDIIDRLNDIINYKTYINVLNTLFKDFNIWFIYQIDKNNNETALVTTNFFINEKVFTVIIDSWFNKFVKDLDSLSEIIIKYRDITKNLNLSYKE